MGEAYTKRNKRARTDSDDELSATVAKDDIKMQLQEMETKYEDKCRDHSMLESKVSAMKDVHKSVQEELRGVREQLSSAQFDASADRIKHKEVEASLQLTKKELEATNRALAERTADPKVQELTSQLSESRQKIEEKEEE